MTLDFFFFNSLKKPFHLTSAFSSSKIQLERLVRSSRQIYYPLNWSVLYFSPNITFLKCYFSLPLSSFCTSIPLTLIYVCAYVLFHNSVSYLRVLSKNGSSARIIGSSRWKMLRQTSFWTLRIKKFYVAKKCYSLNLRYLKRKSAEYSNQITSVRRLLLPIQVVIFKYSSPTRKE